MILFWNLPADRRFGNYKVYCSLEFTIITWRKYSAQCQDSIIKFNRYNYEIIDNRYGEIKMSTITLQPSGHLLCGGGGAGLLTNSILPSLPSSSSPTLPTDGLSLATAGLIDTDLETGLGGSRGERTWLDLARSSTGFLAMGGFLHWLLSARWKFSLRTDLDRSPSRIGLRNGYISLPPSQS